MPIQLYDKWILGEWFHFMSYKIVIHLGKLDVDSYLIYISEQEYCNLCPSYLKWGLCQAAWVAPAACKKFRILNSTLDLRSQKLHLASLPGDY